MKIHWSGWGCCWLCGLKRVKTTKNPKKVTCSLCKSSIASHFVLTVPQKGRS